MLNIKEQAEVFKLGLQIGFFKTQDVIQWADNILGYTSVNTEFERHTGLKRENVIGKRVLEVLPNAGAY